MLKQIVAIEQLESSLEFVLQSPKDNGVLEMIVRRPNIDQREVISVSNITTETGLDGDNWKTRGSTKTPDGSANPETQITLMNTRMIQQIAGDKENWQLAGDQLFVDLDLSTENLPPLSLLQVGSVILEISATPHTGCKKFSERFGLDALKFISTPEGKSLRLRGVNAKVIQSGQIQVGDTIRKI